MFVNKVFQNLLKFTVIAILILVASLIGRNRAQDSQNQLIAQHFPDSLFNLEVVNINKLILQNKTDQKENYIYIGEGRGYNGKVSILIQTRLNKIITNVIPLANHETHSFFKKLDKNGFFDKMLGKEINIFLENEPLDVISGATISSKAVMQAIQIAYSEGDDIPVSHSSYPVFGLLEVLIIVLLFAGLLVAKAKNVKLKKYLYWISMIISFVILGFVYNQHITLSRISAMLNGYFPSLHNELYFYILLFGSVLIILLTRKNIYCHSVCPFGVAQAILAKTGNAQPFRPKYYKHLKFLQGFIALTVLLISLALNNPTLAQYEVFGAFFQLTANSILFIVLIIVIILSLFIYKPWCNFMCPIDSFFRYIDLSRKSITEVFKKSS